MASPSIRQTLLQVADLWERMEKLEEKFPTARPHAKLTFSWQPQRSADGAPGQPAGVQCLPFQQPTAADMTDLS